MITISDRELLRMLGYGEDYTPKRNNALEATVRYFKERAIHSLSHQ